MGRMKMRQMPQEFELDLAPLLAVMVKLVPVLLLSSAFVQVGVIETDLPQIVKEQIEQQKENPTAQVALVMKETGEVQIELERAGKVETFKVPAPAAGEFDYQGAAAALLTVKKQTPEVFTLKLNPSEKVPYAQIVRMMDSARRTPDKSEKFQLKDAKTGTTTETELMFPDVVFSNIFSAG